MLPARIHPALVAAALLALAACGDSTAPHVDPPPAEGPVLAFSHAPRGGGTARVALVNADGTGLRYVTGTTFPSYAPSWKRDGRTLVVSSPRDEILRLFAVDAAQGGDGTAIPTGDLHAYQGEWSPDGRTLAVTTSGGVVLVKDGVARELETPDTPGDARWSPDGAWLAYTELAPVPSQPGLRRRALFIVRADGTDIRRIAESVNSPITAPAWSPDGTRLAFAAMGQGSADDLFVVTLATDEVVQITTTPEGERSPDWSPDGTRIAYSRALGMGDRHVWTIRVDGTDARQVTGEAGEQAGPRWRPAP